MNLILTLLELVGKVFGFAISTCFDTIGEILSALFNVDDRIYKAEFGNEYKLFNQSNTGWSTSTKQLTLKRSFENFIVFASSGRGKTVKTIIPSHFSLMRGGSSVICNDPSREQLLLTSGAYQQNGYDVYVLDLCRPERSGSFNPIAHTRGSATARNKVAKQLVGANTLGKDEFWNNAAQDLISYALWILSLLEEKYFTLTNLVRMIDLFGSPKELDWLVIQLDSEELLRKHKSVIGASEKTLSNVLSTVKARLVLFNDPVVQRISSISDFKPMDFRRKKSILYIVSNPTEQEYYKPLTSLIFQNFFDQLMYDLPSEKDLAVMYICEEASSTDLCNVNSLVSQCRKYKSGILFCYQSPAQIYAQYGEVAKAVIDNCFVQMYLGGGSSSETASMVEKSLGMTEVENKDGKTVIKPLLLSSELRLLSDDQAIVLCAGFKPLLIETVAFFKIRLKRLSQIPPIDINVERTTEIPLFPISKPPRYGEE